MATSALDVKVPGVHTYESTELPSSVPPSYPIGAYVGEAVRGRTDKAVLISSWSDFVSVYGGFPKLPDAHLNGALAAYLHFQNGGGPLWYVRVVGNGGAGAKKEDLKDHSNGANSIDVYAQNIGKWGSSLSIATERWETSNVATQVVTNNSPSDAGADLPGVVDVKTLLGIKVGDVVDVLDEAGAVQGWGVVGNVLADGVNHTARNLVSGRPYILFADDSQMNGGAGVDAASFTLRSASTHKASTRLSEAYVDGDTVVKVKSSSGFDVGSLISVMLVSCCNDDSTKDKVLTGHARVTVVSGGNLTIAAELAGDDGNAYNQAIAVDSKAFAWSGSQATQAASDGIELTAVPAGSDGNVISYEIIAGAAESCDVAGNHIKITIDNGTTKWTGVKAIIDANAAATKLVSVVTLNNEAGDVNAAAVAKRFLTGGAYATVVSQEFDLTVRDAGKVIEKHSGLTISSSSVDYIGTRLGGTSTPTISDDNESKNIIVLKDAVIADDAEKVGLMPRSFKDTQLAGGTDAAAPSAAEALGDATQGSETGIYLLEGKAGMEVIAIPGFAGADIAAEGAAFAKRNDATFIMDTPQLDSTFDTISNFIQGELAMDDTYLAVYTPWLKMPDPRSSKKKVEIPPTMVAGPSWARSATEGQHVSPANIPMRGPNEASVVFTDAQLGSLNEDLHVNVVRHQQGRGYRVMGARTLSSINGSRKFISVRRWLNHLKRSAKTALADLVFVGANERLMRRVRHILGDFLQAEWRRGALYPAEDESRAYFVKCDEETTTSADLGAGRVIADVRVSPVTPAEKILLGITSETGGITITEAAE